MAVGSGRPVRGGDKDELVFRRLLLGGGRRFRRSGFGGGSTYSLLLRVCSLFEVVVVASDLVLVLIPLTGRSFLGGRPEASIDIKTGQLTRHNITRYRKKNLRRINSELRNDPLLSSRRRTAV
jgi:hypothetical protein